MEITYKTKKLQKVCNNYSEAQKTYNKEMADKIHMRIDEISAAESVEMMIQFKIGRCHDLKGNRKGQYAVDLVHPYRMIFKKDGEKTEIVKIVEIADYH